MRHSHGHDQDEGRWAIKLVTPPVEQPITIGEAKDQLHLDESDDDTFVRSLISAATDVCQVWTGRQFVTATFDYFRDSFPHNELILLPRPPLISVGSISFVEPGGGAGTVISADFRVDNASQPGRITPTFGKVWPTTEPVTNAVTIRFDAGFGPATAVPESIKAAMKLLIGFWYEQREDVSLGVVPLQINRGAAMLLWSNRVVTLA